MEISTVGTAEDGEEERSPESCDIDLDEGHSQDNTGNDLEGDERALSRLAELQNRHLQER